MPEKAIWSFYSKKPRRVISILIFSDDILYNLIKVLMTTSMTLGLMFTLNEVLGAEAFRLLLRNIMAVLIMIFNRGYSG